MTPVCKIQCAMKKDLETEDGHKFADTKSECSRRSLSPRNREESNDKKKNSPDSGHLKPVHKAHSSKRDHDDAGKYGECSKRDNSPTKATSPTRSREPVSEKKERERPKVRYLKKVLKVHRPRVT
uniref:Uncharacterized protein n=1 Tax=Heliothis virescens TaxID=7102 RepID=A0A2A4IXH0_HELVI